MTSLTVTSHEYALMQVYYNAGDCCSKLQQGSRCVLIWDRLVGAADLASTLG